MAKTVTSCSVILLIALCSCQAPAPPVVQHWGTVHEALGRGQTQARVALGEVARPGFWGVGALAELQGEATIADGEVWTSIGHVDGPTTVHGRGSSAAATVLFGGSVQRWKRVAVTDDVPGDQLAAFVLDQAAAVGLDTARPFVFRVEGPLRDLEVHVIAGQCPIRARLHGELLDSPPFRASFAVTSGRIVGIHALAGGGVFSHAGHTTHTHVILAEAPAMTGHVESVGLRPGAVLYLPAPD